ncbi:MAG: hypothetical protein AB7O24_30350 [Kofleriaceae bacterium]
MGLIGRRFATLVIGWACASACSSGKPKVIEDAKRVTPAHADAAISHEPSAPPGVGVGDVQVRVEWIDVPPEVRRSPGRTPCNTPRRPSVQPSTTWGIGEVVVLVDGDPTPLGEATVRIVECAPTPRIAIGTSLVIESSMPQPVKLSLAKRGELPAVDRLEPGSPRTIMLPIAGHSVAAELDANAIYELATDAGAPETAWLITGRAAITDVNGTVLIRDVPTGVHAVTAWLPPRGGQPARQAIGQVTVVADDLAELTLKLTP